MNNPNILGHYYRDIVSSVVQDRHWMLVTLSCGHVKEMSKYAYKNFGSNATLCVKCGEK